MNKRHALYPSAALVSLATFAVYLAALRNEFIIWDDDQYVLENPFIRSLDLRFFKWAGTTFYAGNWHPLTWVSHALDYAVWGLNPLGHHLTNILLHAANTLLVVLVCVKLLELWKERQGGGPSILDDRGLLTAAGVAGLLFGLHPLHVESVAWVAERKDLLCGLFYLLSILFYTEHACSAATDTERQGGVLWRFDRPYLLSLLFFTFALLSKPMAVSLPAVLLILDWHPFRRFSSLRAGGAVIREKLPFAAFSLIVSLITLYAQRTASLHEAALAVRLQVASQALVSYLGKMAVPVGLAPFYPYPDRVPLFSMTFLVPFVAVCSITVLAVVLAKQGRRLVPAIWAYYCVTLLPVIGIIKVGEQSMADRYTYLPSAGPFLLLGLAAAWAGNRVLTGGERKRTARRAVIAAGISLLLVLSIVTMRQIVRWRNGIDLWTSVIDAGGPPVPLAHYNRGLGFMRSGRYDEAVLDYSTAIGLDPRYVKAYTNRGLAYRNIGRHDLALADYDRAIELDPLDPIPYNNRGSLLGETGWPDLALPDLGRAISLKPDYAHAYFNRGIALRDLGRFDQALSDLNRAIELEPSQHRTYELRAEIFSALGIAEKAIPDYDRAVSLDPDSPLAYLGRGALYLRTGQAERAVLDFQEACMRGSSEGCDAAARTATMPPGKHPHQER